MKIGRYITLASFALSAAFLAEAEGVAPGPQDHPVHTLVFEGMLGVSRGPSGAIGQGDRQRATVADALAKLYGTAIAGSPVLPLDGPFSDTEAKLHDAVLIGLPSNAPEFQYVGRELEMSTSWARSCAAYQSILHEMELRGERAPARSQRLAIQVRLGLTSNPGLSEVMAADAGAAKTALPP